MPLPYMQIKQVLDEIEQIQMESDSDQLDFIPFNELIDKLKVKEDWKIFL